ncbi:DNA-binding response regulator, OmpR family, contains REC and winged-helix (wHTH) domain [Acetitomaculum ruminis DSM 5522]|uniref:Stage 0 sporulation protein A homolog n=1 Tax=Acetitomaculum ruminis DSM 5522 TaxID=1120918 RepID=A0A1I0Y8Y7_9FIRM|nr:response regulator transcription factor [Acetitomaculum ruminis]SFB09257.1 DNA-binding response regulator, OmpR family, contains REC and winged-helix (wHTH) domain [Acetitomaculum ruminis DSM 5522]
MSKIFIVEDDKVIAESIIKQLKSWHMDAVCVKNFENIVGELKEYNPNLVLLDIGLPFFNGFYWCTKIREFSKVPIVFLSSADDSMNIVMAMNMGGDDFISKPFDMSVLIAKIQAVLRRSGEVFASSNSLLINDVILNLDECTMIYEGDRIDLTKNEFLILRILFENKGKLVSREQIMERLWGAEEFVDDNTLTVNMTRIRKKLMKFGKEDMIVTKRGMGYIVEEK